MAADSQAAGAAESPIFTPVRRVILAGLLLFVVTVLAYIPAMQAGFIWDDDSFLYENPLIHASDGLRRFWFTTEATDYFPLTSSTLWFEWRLFGMSPAGYHVINVLLHSGSALLLWRILWLLQIPGAWTAALLFGLHPVNVESVAWITERKNTLSMFFYCVAGWCYLRSERGSDRRLYVAAIVAFALSLLSKTAGVMLPVVLLLLAWWQRGRVTRRDITRLVPFFALSLALGLVTIWFQAHRAIASDVVNTDTMAARVASAGRAIWFYLGKAMIPLRLNFVYPRWEVDARNLLHWLPLLALLALLAAAYGRRQGSGKHVLTAFAIYVVSLLPVVGLVDIYFMNYSRVSDHWQYFALPAIITLVVGAVAALASLRKGPRWVRPLLTAIAATIFFGLTWQRQAAFHNTEALWLDTLKKNSAARLAHNNLATHYEALGKLDLARHHIDAALKLAPADAVAHFNRGNVLEKSGSIDEALSEFREAIRLKPGFVDAHLNAGRLLLDTGDHDGAHAYFSDALRLAPSSADAQFAMANLLVERGQPADAIRHFQETIRLRPAFAEAHTNYGNLLLKTGDSQRAAEQFRQALEIDPDDLFAHYNLAVLLQNSGESDKALHHIGEALRINPNWEPALRKREELKQGEGIRR